MSTTDVKTELQEVRQKHKNGMRREKYWRDKYHDYLELEEDDHRDLSAMMEALTPTNLPKEM